MKYVANPVVVDAYIIKAISYHCVDGIYLLLDNDTGYIASLPMCARYDPKIGDYLVTQSDGYTYINPKEVFERKYSLLEDVING